MKVDKMKQNREIRTDEIQNMNITVEQRNN